MATSMQFGPEWMRKGPNSKSGGKENPASTTPSAATSPGTGPVAGNAASSNGSGGTGKRNGGSGGLGNLSGPTPVISPAVSSPGAFSFAAAAAAATAQASDRNSTNAPASHGSSGGGGGDADASAAMLNGSSAALAKDKVTREKLLSLYSSDRSSKALSSEPSPVEPVPSGAGSGPERSTSTSRRKAGSDRRPSAFSELGGGGGGGGGPLSPGLTGNEPRGLNARSTSGSSSGGFGSAGTSNWDKAEKERPGLFQRVSNGALAGVTANSGSRPLSPSVSRDRFSGIQGGVLSGVAPPARKRMDSSDGASAAVEASRTGRSLRSSQDETNASATTNGIASGAGSWGRSAQASLGHGNAIGNGGGVMGAFSDAFSSNRVRGRNASAAADTASLSTGAAPASAAQTAEASQPTQPIVPSGNPEGLSISARFARHKDRLPGEGPIGPPSDGSIGFGKSSGFDRRRERQTSQARLLQSQAAKGGDAGAFNTGSAAIDASSSEKAGALAAQEFNSQVATARDSGPGSDDPDLAQHASAVLGSLKLDEDDSPGLPTASALAQDQPSTTSERNTDNFLRGHDHFPQAHQQQHANHASQAPMQAAPWLPETSMWLYRDMAGNVQGPFSSVMMQDWYSQQYFADDLLIKRQEDADFKPLAQIVAAIGNALQPFVIPPSSWLHSPAPPRPAFETTFGGKDSLLGPEQSRFSDAFDSNRSWTQGGRQQQQQQQQQQPPQQPQQLQQQPGWPAPLALGGLGSGGPSPASPFGRPDIFTAGQSGLRNQDDLMSILREREMHEQRQAAAAASRGPGGMHLGQLDSFGAGLGRSGWGNESAMSPSHWGGIGHGGLGQFGDVGLGGHQSPLVGDRPAFDNFGHQQRQNFDQAGSPWSNKASLASRSQFDSMRPVQQGQWGEQQAPWNYSATTPDVTNRQMDFSEGVLRNEAIKAADPIGTPRRARSPAPQHDVAFANQQAVEQKDELHRSFESAFPAPAQEEQTSVDAPSTSSATSNVKEKASADAKIESSAEAAKTSTPQKKLSKKDAQRAAAAAATTAAASAGKEDNVPDKAVETEIPPPEAFTAEEPRPEELWPQSPKAVEFASEPELSGMPALTLASNKSTKDARREPRSALQRQASEASRIVPGSGELANRSAAAARSTGAGNVRVVSQEQFRRGVNGDNTSTATQAPLSDWLDDGSAAESPAPASRPAPWAAKDDSTQSTGPSLREIQEAEAKRAEARRAAEKAAARARMAASPSADEELPTTLSWGLASAPASKTVNTSSGGGEGAGAATAGPAAPAWNAGKAAPKKTLMEIQEEERKRAEKLKAQQAAQAIALRKGYADSAGRSTSASSLHGAVVAPISSSANASSGGGAWSVVGASGKPTTPGGANSSATSAANSVGGGGFGLAAAAAPAAPSPLARPGLASTPRTASVGSMPSSNSGSAWSIVGNKATGAASTAAPASPSPVSRVVSSQSTLGSVVKPPRTAPAAADPNAPSPEFIKYCKDNLQGLTIKTDDFIDMLLQFPLDPSADVIEIIADTVYANSSTLDGRRFANDFVSKRKLDVQGRTGGASRWGAASGGGMGNFGVGVKSSPLPGKGAPVARPPGVGVSDTGFKVVKGKGAKKRT